MFGKKKNIEDDFLAYGSQSQSKKNTQSKGVLGSLIQFLIVVVLIGVVVLMGIFGYRYFQNSTGKNLVAAGAAQPETAANNGETFVAAAASATVQNSGKQRLYTQEEMQEIVKMLMEQMQTTRQNQTADTPPAAAGTAVTQNAVSNENPDALVAALDIAEVDNMEDEELVSAAAIDESKIKEVQSSKNVKKVDHYNKVVVEKRENTYDDLANLSAEIGTIVEDMKSKKTKQSSYTASIKKEVSVRSSEMRVIIVKEGDSLSKIAKRAYGSAQAYERILKANPDLIKNPNNIYVGQRLRVPVK